jgi:uncharacterized membrane protein
MAGSSPAMTMSGVGSRMTLLILGLIVFIGAHAFTMARGARAWAIARLGEGPYKGLYSLVSLIGLVLIVWGFGEYRASGYTQVWNPPVWARHLAVPLVWLSFVAFAAAYLPGRIRRALKHPMLAGLKIWALAHLLANGDLGSVILFGSVLAWAVIDRISLKRRTDPGAPPIPVGGMRNDVIAVFGGIALYAVLGWWFHPYVIGVPAFGA